MYLIQRNRVSHTRLTFAVRQVGIVTDTVFGILNDDMHFRAFLHQVTRQAKGNVIGIFIFVKLVFPYPSDSSGVRTAVSADYIETGTRKSVGSNFDICQFLAKQGVIDGSSYF